jgi:hypothetical protein
MSTYHGIARDLINGARLNPSSFITYIHYNNCFFNSLVNFLLISWSQRGLIWR